tara:strand:+ start:707 stop:1078 length:372 start_codon:yes stop_codon:yes gene_type:complete
MNDDIIILIMGNIDNVLVAVGVYYSLASIERYMESYFINYKASQQLIACVSACLANTVSDGIGFLATGSWEWALWVMIGCLSGMFIIPVMEFIKYMKKKNKESRLHPKIHIWGTSIKSKTDED